MSFYIDPDNLIIVILGVKDVIDFCVTYLAIWMLRKTFSVVPFVAVTYLQVGMICL